ncbi:MAG: hypothetical protein CMM84_00325, partial [Rhodothermaceae bacterium]|nr:hypothetical protein [Rhodothermaceae bacterium]
MRRSACALALALVALAAPVVVAQTPDTTASVRALPADSLAAPPDALAPSDSLAPPRVVAAPVDPFGAVPGRVATPVPATTAVLDLTALLTDAPAGLAPSAFAYRLGAPGRSAGVALDGLDPAAPAPDGAITWDDLTAQAGPLEFAPLAFDHPLYVLFSSGTTGLPKPIVHGHGGITLEHTKGLSLHLDLGPQDRFFWFSTTGWMMWNLLISGLLTGSTIVMFDGNPAPPDDDGNADVALLWRLAERLSITYFGTSA